MTSDSGRRPCGRTVAVLLAGLLLAMSAGCGGEGPDANLDVGGIDLGQVLDGLVARTQHAIDGISGVDSAKQANSELTLINQDFDDLLYHLPGLNPEGRARMAQKAARALPDLSRITNRIHEMPALDDVIGATLDEMLTKLEQVR